MASTPKKFVSPNFPTTNREWVLTQLDRVTTDGQLGEHLVRHYLNPLRLRYARSRWRDLGPAEQMVLEFLGELLLQPRILRKWKDSNRRLRDWLWTGLRYHLRQVIRLRNRRRAEVSFEDLEFEPEGCVLDEPERQEIREWVGKALGAAQERCEADGLASNWKAFSMRWKDDMHWHEIGSALGLSADQAASRLAPAAERFRRTLAEQLREHAERGTEIYVAVMRALGVDP